MNEFLQKLDRFISEVSSMPRFKGQTHAVRALKRIAGLAVFK